MIDDTSFFLSELPSPVRHRIARASQLRSVRKGEIVFPDGAQATWVGHLIDGTLGMVKTLQDGRAHIIGLLLPPDMFGRLFDGPLPYAIKALSDARILCIERTTFEQMLIDSPEIERAFVLSMQDELDQTREWIVVLSGKRITERVAAFLTMLVRRQATPANAARYLRKKTMIRLPLSRADLALCLGLRAESLSRAIHALARDGVIRIIAPDLFEVPDTRALVEASGHDFRMDGKAEGRRSEVGK